MSLFSNKNRLIYILIAVIAIVVFLTVILVIRNIGGTQRQVTLEFWGVFDNRTAFESVIDQFEQLYPNIQVNYRSQPAEGYEENLINALASGTGPDIFMIHNTWLPKHISKLRAMPSKIPGLKEPLFTLSSYKNQFVDVVSKDLIYDDQIFGVPLYVDTLALFYNKDIFNSLGITQPPATWEDFNNLVERITSIDPDGNIIRSAAAIGTSRNINRSTDILMGLMLQSGVGMTDEDNTQATFAQSVDRQAVGQIALQYYTDFANPNKRVYTWNDNMHYSIDAFVEGSTAMMFNYSHQIPVIREKSPRLNLGISAMPQLDVNDARNFANYWAPGVSSFSQNYNEAWQFLAYLSSKDGVLSYLTATNRPAARKDLIDAQRTDEQTGVFALQSLSATSWFQVEEGEIEKIFADMIDDVNFRRRQLKDALSNAESRVNVLMARFRQDVQKE